MKIYFTPEDEEPFGMPPAPCPVGELPVGTELLMRATIVESGDDTVTLAVGPSRAAVRLSRWVEVGG